MRVYVGLGCSLDLVHSGIAAAEFDELVVGSGFGDTALFDDEDLVGVADGGESVGYRDDGVVTGDGADGFLYLLLGFYVD